MFLLLLTIILLLSVLNFIWFNKTQGKRLPPLIATIGFVLSWVSIVLWFTSLVELWQISLNTPQAQASSIPAWSQQVLAFFHFLVDWLPLRRLALGVLYALPFLVVPTAVALTTPSPTTPILTLSTWVNLLLFWILTLIDGIASSSFIGMSIHGMILFMAYALMILALSQQQKFIHLLKQPAHLS